MIKTSNDSIEGFNPDAHQVFVYVCPSCLPIQFAVHPWFVVNEKGNISRWEVLFRKIRYRESWGHLCKNYLTASSGIEIIPAFKVWFWRSRQMAKIEGDTAKRIIDLIKKSPQTYPYTDLYFLTGPNSNTYVQWILNQFPELHISLPWNAFGKGYAAKQTM